MKRILLPFLLIVILFTNTTLTSCNTKNGDPTGPAIFLAAVLILGITVGGWFQHDHPDDKFPPDKYDLLSWNHPEMKIDGSILNKNERDWYRTDLMRPGERIEIWSESSIGVKAIMVDQYGRSYPSDNWAPGTNFHFEIQAPETTSYYLMVMGTDEHAIGPYKIHWRYHY